MAFELFKGKKFTQITSSVDIKPQDLYRKIPSVLRLGKKEKTQGGFFSYDRILSASDKNLGAPFYDDDAVKTFQDPTTGEMIVMRVVHQIVDTIFNSTF